MKKNVGSADRMVRSIAAIIVSLLYLNHVITGVLAGVLLALAAIFLVTGFLSFCPTYVLFKVSTCKNRQLKK